MLALIEQHAGASLRTREDVVQFFEALKVQAARRQHAAATRHLVRELIIVCALVGAFGQYYFWDVSLQISKLPKAYYFVSAST